MLSREIRGCIYAELLAEGHVHTPGVLSIYHSKRRTYPAILRASRQVYEKARPILYNAYRFSICISDSLPIFEGKRKIWHCLSQSVAVHLFRHLKFTVQFPCFLHPPKTQRFGNSLKYILRVLNSVIMNLGTFRLDSLRTIS